MKKPIPFGKYLLLERINVGGMAEVFKAKAFGVEGFERLVAVKRILPSIAEDTEFIEMFTDEAKIAVQLTHANIAQIFDLGRVAGSYFITLEYIHGKDLRSIFDRVRKRGELLSVPMACFVMMKVCEGLDYAHNKKSTTGRDLSIVHRDVSPQNILISYDGEVKIIDFGIAKAVGKASKTQAGILKGKFGYMSPEQVRGLPLDRRSDIFAVGIVLYELLTGERLFVGESDFSTLEKVRNVEIMPPSSYNKRIPEELEKVVLKALSREVEDRYQTATDLHDDLQSFMYTSSNFFARKDLGAYMRKLFGEEIAKESAKDAEYAKIGSRSSGLEAFDSLPGAAGVQSPPRKTPEGTPPSPRGRLGTAPPLPPGQTVRPPAPRSPAPPSAGGASVDMDWDEEELSTKTYDRPDVGGAQGKPTLAAQPVAIAAQTPTSPISRPPASTPPQGPVGPGAAAPPAFRRGPRLPDAGASPSFHTPPTGAPGMKATLQPEPTPVTARPAVKRTGGGLLAAVAVMALLLLATGGIGGYFVFFRSSPGTIQLTTMPVDPVVLFDAHPVQATSSPFVVSDVAPGEMHLLEVSRAGYQTWSQQVRIQSGQRLTLGPVVLVPTGPTIAAGGTGLPPLPPPPAGATGFSIDTQPTGARIFVDDRPLAQQTPAQITDLAPGAHTIRVDAGSAYDVWQTQITVSPGQMIALPRRVLNLRNVAVDFRSTPDGARIVLLRGSERRPIGSTPVRANVDPSGGVWTVTVSKDGYNDFTEALSLPTGQATYAFEATLTRSAVATAGGEGEGSHTRPHHPHGDGEPVGGNGNNGNGNGNGEGGGGDGSHGGGGTGTLRINTRPWSQVFVDGQLMGNTPQMNLQLRAGAHRVTLVNSEFNVRETITVNITAGATETRVLTLTPGG